MRTSITHPLRIDWLPVEGDKGRIGMTLCPGKYQPVSWTGGWDRQLDLDFEALKDNATSKLISLVTEEDMEVLRVTQLPEVVEANDIEWVHLPLPDCTVPTREWLRRSIPVFTELQTSIAEGGRVVVHCMGGLSRAGTFVAIYLYLRGYSMTDAIRRVRTERDGRCINTKQEAFLFDLETQHMDERSKIERYAGDIGHFDGNLITWAEEHLCNWPVNSKWRPYGSGVQYIKSDLSTWQLTSIVDHPFARLSHAAFTKLIETVGLTMDDKTLLNCSENALSTAEFSVRLLFKM